MTDILVHLLVGILPVVLFLVGLVYLDTYKLIRLRWILASLLAGGVAASACYVVNTTLTLHLPLEPWVYSRYVAPAIEEFAKGLLVVYVIRSHKVGFLVDAAIFGFALGTGFAVVENAHYVWALPGTPLSIWLIRGFGTAIMHGGTTCLLAIVSKGLSDWRESTHVRVFLPGLSLAIVVHSFYNHVFVSPVLGTLGILLTLPPLLVLVFSRSERALQRWLDSGFDEDMRLLELIDSGQLSKSPVGRHLESLRGNFPDELVADLLCYLRLHVELALRAKGLLLMRESGFEVPPDEDTRAKFVEMAHLERHIGKSGRRAMVPFLHVTGKQLWQLHMLGR